MKPYLETERMILLPFVKEDRPLIKDLDSDPDVVRYISNGVPSDDQEVDRAMGIFLSLNEKYDQKLGFWKAINKETNEFMGWFHLRPLKSNLDDTDTLELGYRFKKIYWGKGFATEGTKALIEKAVNEFKPKRICAHAMLANTGSINVMKKSGLLFELEETYEPWPGEDKRCVWYGLKFDN